jgi:hypothetical protein
LIKEIALSSQDFGGVKSVFSSKLPAIETPLKATIAIAVKINFFIFCCFKLINFLVVDRSKGEKKTVCQNIFIYLTFY